MTVAARSYAIDRRPSVIELASEDDALDVCGAFESDIAGALGARVFVERIDACLLLPPPHQVWRDGRVLRGDESDAYAAACLTAASRLAPRAIRFHVEEMFVIDWHARGAPIDRGLTELFASLPHCVDAQAPIFFGRDEQVGPWLSASVEPPGLHVFGLLEPERFDAWRDALLGATRTWPFRTLG